MNREILDLRKEKYVGELPQKGITGKKAAPAGICTYLHTKTMTNVMMMMRMMTMIMTIMVIMMMMTNQALQSRPCSQCKYCSHCKADRHPGFHISIILFTIIIIIIIIIF